jgi:DNA-directed RNA polymerase specialized sigma24 family protein
MHFPTEAKLSETFLRLRKPLTGTLRNRFRLTYYQAEDLVQDVWAEAVALVRNGRELTGTLESYLRWLAYRRAIDLLRREKVCREAEAELFERLRQREEAPSIGSQVAEQERRGRQGLLLSELLQEFCRECETHRPLAIRKEVYERTCRGEDVNEIVAAMGLTCSQVFNERRAARDWLRGRILQVDVNRSVFATLHQLVYRDEEKEPSGRAAAEAVPVPARGSGLPGPEGQTVLDVVRWVIETARGFCPSPGRLLEWSRRRDANDLRDVRYHVVDIGCKACRSELERVEGVLDE